MRYKIKNWHDYQHYKNRSPAWIKLHNSLLTSEAWVMSDDPTKTLIVASMLLAARNEENDGTFNGDPEYVKRFAYLNATPNFKPLIQFGFIELVQDASNTLANCYTEKRREEESREREEGEKEKRERREDSSDDAKASRLKNVAVWESYEKAYFNKYGVEPVRNAKVNSQIAQLRKRLGDDAVHVAGWFLTHRNGWYTQKMHSLDCLLNDAEKLRTEWATGQQMTQSRATQVDKSTGSGNSFLRLIEEAK
jgi:hypothetical protein